MSRKSSVGLTAAEKFFGLILLIVGALATHHTFANIKVLGHFTWLFGLLSILLLALGLFLIIAKTE